MSTFCVIMASFFIPSEVGVGELLGGKCLIVGAFYLVTFVFLLEYNVILIYAFNKMYCSFQWFPVSVLSGSLVVSVLSDSLVVSVLSGILVVSVLSGSLVVSVLSGSLVVSVLSGSLVMSVLNGSLVNE